MNYPDLNVLVVSVISFGCVTSNERLDFVDDPRYG